MSRKLSPMATEYTHSEGSNAPLIKQYPEAREIVKVAAP